VDLGSWLGTTAFLAIELWLLTSVHLGRRPWRWLWVLPPMCAIWINWHGGWPQGLVMLVAIAVALAAMEVRRRWRGHGGTSHLTLRSLAMILGACGLALFINPYGLDLITFPRQMEAAWIRAAGSGTEWQSPLAWRGWTLVGGGQVIPIHPLSFLYLALLICCAAGALRRWRTADLVPIAVMGLWPALSLWHLRTVSDMALLTSPLVAASLRSERWRTKPWPVWVGLGFLLGLLALGLWREWCVRGDYWRWSRHEPRCVESAVERLGQPVRVFGLPHLAWLLYRFPDRVKVQDTWEYVAGPQRTLEGDAIWNGHAPLGPYLERYHVDVIILNTGAYGNVPLLTSMGWALIHIEDRFFVMVPRRPDMEALIEHEGYRHIVSWENRPVTVENARHVLAEAERALRHCPDQAAFVWSYKAKALRLLGRHQEAWEAGLKIPETLVIK
jgi:hypothetical protein